MRIQKIMLSIPKSSVYSFHINFQPSLSFLYAPSHIDEWKLNIMQRHEARISIYRPHGITNCMHVKTRMGGWKASNKTTTTIKSFSWTLIVSSRHATTNSWKMGQVRKCVVIFSLPTINLNYSKHRNKTVCYFFSIFVWMPRDEIIELFLFFLLPPHSVLSLLLSSSASLFLSLEQRNEHDTTQERRFRNKRKQLRILCIQKCFGDSSKWVIYLRPPKHYQAS